MSVTWLRRLVLVLAGMFALGLTCRYVPLDLLRPGIERALGRGLGRQVEVGSVYLNLFGAPGFTLEDVTIHEDPRAGFEPFAYVESLNASVRWLSLFRRHLDFTSLSLSGDTTTINVVKPDSRPLELPIIARPREAERHRSRHQDAQRAGELQVRRHQISLLFQSCGSRCRACPETVRWNCVLAASPPARIARRRISGTFS